MKDEGDVYRRLQERLDELPVGYPATASGVELRILKQLFTPEEAEVALGLNAVPETVEKIQPACPADRRKSSSGCSTVWSRKAPSSAAACSPAGERSVTRARPS